MDEDEVLSKITRLLEQGCTMLAAHHDCGAPLFRCQGEVVCPVCSFPDKPSSIARAPGTASQLDESGPEVEPLSQKETQKEAMESPLMRSMTKEAIRDEWEDLEFMKAKANLRASLLRRLGELTAGLEVEQDLDKLKKQLDCIEGLLRAFRSMQG
jgi:UPF0148 protein